MRIEILKCYELPEEKIRNLEGSQQREVKAASFIPYSRHFDDTTLKTKSGYLLKVIKIEGLPFETADQIDLNTRKNIRATLLRGISNSRFAVYHHTIRRRVSDKLPGLFENDWCRKS